MRCVAELWYSRNKAGDSPGLPATTSWAPGSSASFADQLYDNQGMLLATRPSTASHCRTSTISPSMALVDQMVWRRAGTPDQVSVVPADHGGPPATQFSNLFIEAGSTGKPVWPGRDSDVSASLCHTRALGRQPGNTVRTCCPSPDPARRMPATRPFWEATISTRWRRLVLPRCAVVVNPGATLPAASAPAA